LAAARNGKGEAPVSTQAQAPTLGATAGINGAAALRGSIDEPALISGGARSWRPTPSLDPIPPSRLGGPKGDNKDGKSAGEAKPPQPAASATLGPAPQAPRSRFLRRAHLSACKTFGTVLGPEANDAHRNHFHIDMAERQSGSYCE